MKSVVRCGTTTAISATCGAAAAFITADAIPTTTVAAATITTARTATSAGSMFVLLVGNGFCLRLIDHYNFSMLARQGHPTSQWKASSEKQ